MGGKSSKDSGSAAADMLPDDMKGKDLWKAMQQRGRELANTVDLLLMADQDKQSRTDDDGDGKVDTWRSHLVHAQLVRKGAGPKQPYTLRVVEETDIVVDVADGSQRGAEFSSLCFFNGKLLTCDDRTGKIFSIEKLARAAGEEGPSRYKIHEEYTCLDADGSDDTKGFKAEWMTVKDGKLVVGSHGRPESDPRATRKDRMRWIKIIDGEGKIEHVDWSANFDAMAKHLGVDPEKGYVTHESGLWSQLHQRWLFYPRRISQTEWTVDGDPFRGANMLVAATSDFSTIASRRVLPLVKERGCADLDFIPRTGESEIVAVRTYEVEDDMDSFVSVFNLEGRVLMKETKVLSGLKLEGCICVVW